MAVARALARRPAALLLDEPLSALDTRSRAAGGRELAAVLAETGVPALLVTHDFTEAALLGDRVGVIDGGRVIQQGTAAELAASPASAFVADFTGAVVLTGTARAATTDSPAWRSTAAAPCSARARLGPVAVSVYPWEIALAPAGTARSGSAQNHLPSRSCPHRRRQPHPRRARRAPAAHGRDQRGLGARARPDPGRLPDRELEGAGDTTVAPVKPRYHPSEIAEVRSSAFAK